MAKYTPIQPDEPTVDGEEPAPEYTALEIEEPAPAGSQETPAVLTNGQIYKRLPGYNASTSEVIEWLNLLVQRRATQVYVPPLRPDSDLPFLQRSDLDSMTEEELQGILPSVWPENLRLMIVKDVKRHVKTRQVSVLVAPRPSSSYRWQI